MKRFAKMSMAVLLSVALLISIVACSKSNNENSSGSNSSASSSSGSATQKVTLNYVDWCDSIKDPILAMNGEFEKNNPGVTVNFTSMTQDQFRNTTLVSIAAGDAPDLFPLPSGTYLSTALAQNWYQPMSDYVSQSMLDSFLPGQLNEGITSIGGKVYVVSGNTGITSLIFYNKKILDENKIDPSTLTTWTAFENALKTVTANGKGKYYGIIDGFTQVNRLEIMARSFAAMAGAECNAPGTIAYTDDGKSWFNSQPMLDAMGYLQKLAKDKVFSPDSTSISAPEARALFGQGKAAFIMQGSYCIGVWKKNNPDLEIGIMAVPYPDSGKKGSLTRSVEAGLVGISSTCKNPEVAGKYLDAFYSEDFQGKLVASGAYCSPIKGVNDKYEKDPVIKEYYAMTDKEAKLAPNAIIGNVNCADVYADAKSISPSLGQITQGVLAGAITDYETPLNTLADASSTEWQRAINAVNSKGKNVSVADFQFPNWDMSKDYTSSDYKSK